MKPRGRCTDSTVTPLSRRYNRTMKLRGKCTDSTTTPLSRRYHRTMKLRGRCTDSTITPLSCRYHRTMKLPGSCTDSTVALIRRRLHVTRKLRGKCPRYSRFPHCQQHDLNRYSNQPSGASYYHSHLSNHYPSAGVKGSQNHWDIWLIRNVKKSGKFIKSTRLQW